MTRRLIAALICWSLAVAHTCARPAALARTSREAQSAEQGTTPAAAARPPADPNKFAVIISGASGGEAYAKQFAQWTASLRRTLTERLGFAEDRVKVLTETPADGAAATSSSSRATADEVRRAFAALRGAVGPDGALFIFLIGHGTFDGLHAKFNLVGPDLDAGEYRSLIGTLSAQRVVIVNMTSASGEFVKPLSARGRVVVTATRSGQEQNATHFAEHFIEALNATDADADQNGRISVLEAFNYASKLTAQHYQRAGHLATEHALLDDNGDGSGHQTAEGGDGAVARTTYFDSLTMAEANANAQTARLLRERTRLEEEIEQLKARKSGMPPSEYEGALEKLFVELAKVNRAVKRGGL